MLATQKMPAELALFGAALVFVLLALVGAVRAYSPVPYWDMWNGYLEFYVRAQSGDLSAWWGQHNEHRIILTRLLFWADLRFFRGASVFLVLTNFVLLAAICVVFVATWRERCSKAGQLFLVAWLFSWSQQENLTSGFQSQFMLAQLLPLVAFCLLHKSASDETKSLRYFLAASVCGALAIGSMANGVIALPLMTLFSVLVKNGWRRSSILAALSLLGVILYFHGYVAPGGHGSIRQALLHNPVGLMQFVLAYIGGPFSFLVGNNAAGLLIAKIAGGFLILRAGFCAWRSLQNPRKSTLALAMLFFILYVGGTALGTAGGRLIFGVEQALSSRYMTPALMAWAALAVMAVPPVLTRFPKGVTSALLLLLVALLPQQLKALEPKRAELFERNVAALAIELGIRDQAQISHVFPSAEWALAVAKEPVERNLSVFGNSPLKDLRERVGKASDITQVPAVSCNGYVDEAREIKEDSGFLQLRGWIFDGESEGRAEVLPIVDQDRVIVGFVYTGQERPDVAKTNGARALRSGFKGYLSSASIGKPAFIVGPRARCRLNTVSTSSPEK